MSDEALRELERAWRATGDPELELAYVQALVRAGLPRPRLLLAAYLGSAGALALLGDLGFPEEPGLGAWLAGLGAGRLGREPELARASSLRAVLCALEVAGAAGADVAALEPLRARAEDWLRAPSQPAREALRALRARTPARDDPLAPAAEVIDQAVRVVTAHQVQGAARAASRAVRGLAQLMPGPQRARHARLREAIARHLLAWALRSDP